MTGSVLERVKKSFAFEERVPVLHQVGGALGLTMTAGFWAQVATPMAFSQWSDQIPFWVGGFFATPYVLKGLASLSDTLALSLLWCEGQVFSVMVELGKFALFAGAVLGLTVTAVHARNLNHLFTLPIPEPVLLREWVAAYWDHPVFLTLVGLSFVLYRGIVWAWRRRPESLEMVNPARTS